MNIRKRDEVTILDIEGQIFGSDSLALKGIIDEQVVAANENGIKLLVNLKGVHMVDRSGFRLFVSAHTRVEQRGGRLALLNDEQLNGLIAISRLMDVLKYYDNEDEAIVNLHEPVN